MQLKRDATRHWLMSRRHAYCPHASCVCRPVSFQFHSCIRCEGLRALAETYSATLGCGVRLSGAMRTRFFCTSGGWKGDFPDTVLFMRQQIFDFGGKSCCSAVSSLVCMTCVWLLLFLIPFPEQGRLSDRRWFWHFLRQCPALCAGLSNREGPNIAVLPVLFPCPSLDVPPKLCSLQIPNHSDRAQFLTVAYSTSGFVVEAREGRVEDQLRICYCRGLVFPTLRLHAATRVSRKRSATGIGSGRGALPVSCVSSPRECTFPESAWKKQMHKLPLHCVCWAFWIPSDGSRACTHRSTVCRLRIGTATRLHWKQQESSFMLRRQV